MRDARSRRSAAPVFPILVSAGHVALRALRELGVPSRRCIETRADGADQAGLWSGIVVGDAPAPAPLDLPCVALGPSTGEQRIARFLDEVRASDARRWPVSATAEAMGASWGLSERGTQILRMACEGVARADMPDLLEVTRATVDTHIALLRAQCRGRRFDDLVAEVHRRATLPRTIGINGQS